VNSVQCHLYKEGNLLKEVLLTDAVVNDGLNYKDLKVAKFLGH